MKHSRICTVEIDHVVDVHLVFKTCKIRHAICFAGDPNISEVQGICSCLVRMVELFSEVWKGNTNWSKEARCSFFLPFMPWTVQLLCAWSFQEFHFLRCIHVHPSTSMYIIVHHCISDCTSNVAMLFHLFFACHL